MLHYKLTNRQARRFLLLKNGLIGNYKFTGKDGIKQFVAQAGCIQYDPIDICGKNAELVLQSRVEGFKKEMLYELLYEERSFLDYYDKNLAIIGIQDWSCFERIREYFRNHSRSQEKVDEIAGQIKKIIREMGPVCSKDIDFGQKVDWYWSNNTKLSRVALETMYYRGELIIHHKKGTQKYYALAKDYIPQGILHAEDPNREHLDYIEWNILRRISAVGLLWNKPSDAWLFIQNMKAEERRQVFKRLIDKNKIIEISVDNLKDKLYCLESDRNLLEEVLQATDQKPRLEFIAPLDSMIWDRKLIYELFGFDYKWEIYTPEQKRRYGYYVLPVLYGDSFIARIEVINHRKQKKLQIKNIWLEQGVKPTKKMTRLLNQTIRRFAVFNDCKEIEYSNFLVIDHR